MLFTKKIYETSLSLKDKKQVVWTVVKAKMYNDTPLFKVFVKFDGRQHRLLDISYTGALNPDVKYFMLQSVEEFINKEPHEYTVKIDDAYRGQLDSLIEQASANKTLKEKQILQKRLETQSISPANSKSKFRL